MNFRRIYTVGVRICLLSLCLIIAMFFTTQGRAYGSRELKGAEWFQKVVPLFPVPNAGMPGQGMAEHSMIIVGEASPRMILVNKGKIIWTYLIRSENEYGDVWTLSNGNILFSAMQYVAEVTPDKKVVWRYDAAAGNEIHTCQPIGLDKVMFVESGLPPHLRVVNIKTHSVEVDHVLPTKSPTDKGIHGQFRRARYTAQGTYLVSFFSMNRVVEYDKDFNIVWSYDVNNPWAAIRLKNGNTLVTDEKDVKTFEVTPDKKIVWQTTPADIPPQYRYSETQSAVRLVNGDTIICSRGGNAHGPQLVEITPSKKVVWVMKDWVNFDQASGVQILDDPGIPEDPGESQH